MFQKRFFTFLAIPILYITTLSGYTLQEEMVEVLNTNPIIQERLKNYRATQQDLDIAESEYYPSIDLSASIGHTEAGRLKTGTPGNNDDFDHNVNKTSYNDYETSLTLTQNLFDGFGTMHKVDFEEARILAAAYKYLEVSNEQAFRMVEVYVNVLSTQELVKTAQQNVQINEDIYNKVNDLFDSGLTTESEVKKIQATLSLSRSNLTVQKNNARDAGFQYRRVLGRLPDISTMIKPIVTLRMPESIERAALYAIENNPSIIVARYDIKGAESLMKQRKKDFYPKVDLELSQAFNDHDELNNGFSQPDDRFKARIILTYNLFRGGADVATEQQNISKISQEIEIRRDLRRQIIEGLDLSWSAYEMLGTQLNDLKDYSQYSEKTLELYKEEYDLGRRSLLDLLSAQNDVINSRSQIIQAEYDYLFAKYRILDALGLLVVGINGTADEFTSKVNLFTDDEAHQILDTLPITFDLDNDKIADNIDLCDNSRKGNNIMPYGCKKHSKPMDLKIIADVIEEPMVEEEPLMEEEPEVILDGDEDGVIDADDKCPTTPAGYNVDTVGCTVSMTMRINFPNNSSIMPDSGKEKVHEFANYLRKNPSYNINIVGYTNNIGSYDYNKWLSGRRANRIMFALRDDGISGERMRSEGRGEDNPVADNNTQEGIVENRRAEIEIIKNARGF
ncbi:TolC family outer membrane protein [Sulfurimonas sp. SAG-AH-194-I05]|nr:TolC family outer membrane protein [Sulfurimonas sp. SAG-AH-194-I05]MDF1875009.1 TolC family outer membrane protein [Sulfurimonas sp. SAG-AH-194-I05]